MNGLVEVTKGSPDDEELAAVVIALEIVAAREAVSAPAEPVSRWRTSLRPNDLSTRREWRSRG
jgi:hypothetical protein